MKGPLRGFWGKLHREPTDAAFEWHPLVAHCADVAACCEALLTRTLLGVRLAFLAGRSSLSPVQIARLCVLAALHDIGKFNLWFQNKAYRDKRPKAGHLSTVATLLGSGLDAEHKLLVALRVEQLAAWGDGDAITDLLVATISHHGRPIPIDRDKVGSRCWEASGDLDPFAGIADLVTRTSAWFPEAWLIGGEALPEGAAFQHAWCGLVTLADWIGSDEDRFFPFAADLGDRMPHARQYAVSACERLGLVVEGPRTSLGPAVPGFDRIAPAGFSPRPAQAAMQVVMPEEGSGSLALLEAETGSGKTEAAVAYFARLFHAGLVDGMYFALPTRTAATQIYQRLRAAMDCLFDRSAEQPAVVLAVPGYLEVDGAQGLRLAPFRVQWPDEPRRDRSWAAEHPKRYMAGAVAVGTVDQALLSSLAVSHSHMRATALLRHLLVVDEVHASDAYMTRILEEVLDHHVGSGGHALLMSATLGAAARERLLAPKKTRSLGVTLDPEAAVDCPYPLISFRQGMGMQVRSFEVAGDPATEKEVRVELIGEMANPIAVASHALAAARAGARVLVIRNTVTDCIATQAAIETLVEARPEDGELLLRSGGLPVPHHSRYAKPDRTKLDGVIEAAFGRLRPPGGCIAVGTQTVEQSLDLDADLLITDLCPTDVLLQRIGRLHRHRDRARAAAFVEARVVVLVPDEPLGTHIQPSGEAFGPHGMGTVYLDLRALEATWRALAARSELVIPRDNRVLVEAATHPTLLESLAAELGDDWVRHQRSVHGKTFSNRQQGKLNVVRRDLSFADNSSGESVAFPSGDTARHIFTRLGLSDRLVRFEPPVPSLFDSSDLISEMTIPHHLVRGNPGDDAVAEAVDLREHGFAFQFGAGSYVYDRLGLRLLSPASAETVLREHRGRP